MTDTEARPDDSLEPAPPIPNTNPLVTAINIIASPGEAFRTLQVHPTSWFPLLLSVVGTLLVYGWYFHMVDYAWYIDDTVARMGNFTAEQQDRMRDAMSQQGKSMIQITGSLGGAIGILFVYALQAGYLTLVSALSGTGYKFKYWFSLICWTSLPYLLVLLVMAVNILLSPNGQLSIYAANSLSLASLGFSGGNNSMLNNVLNGMNLPMFWSIALSVFGYQQWVGSGYLKAGLVVLAPYAVIFGILAYFAFR